MSAMLRRSFPPPVMTLGVSEPTSWLLDTRLGLLAGVLVAVLVALVLGALLGLGLTRASLQRDSRLGATRVGAWWVAPRVGTPEIDPYHRARFARSGEIPMTVGQGIAFQAVRDDAGRLLDLTCSYRLAGDVPRARFWTLGAVDGVGSPLPNAAERLAFTSDEVLRGVDGRFTVALSPDVQPGNWLPLTGRGRFVLVLRLYDTAVTAVAAHDLRTLTVPSIEREGCR